MDAATAAFASVDYVLTGHVVFFPKMNCFNACYLMVQVHIKTSLLQSLSMQFSGTLFGGSFSLLLTV